MPVWSTLCDRIVSKLLYLSQPARTVLSLNSTTKSGPIIYKRACRPAEEDGEQSPRRTLVLQTRQSKYILGLRGDCSMPCRNVVIYAVDALFSDKETLCSEYPVACGPETASW